MIESGRAVKTYLPLMLEDYSTANGLSITMSLDGNLAKGIKNLPVLIQAFEHYENSSEEFLKLGKPIPRLKDIVEFYGELIVLMRDNFTHDSATLLEAITSGPAIALMRMDDSNRAPQLLEQLETLLYDSLLNPVASEQFDEILEKLTQIYEEIPLPTQRTTQFQLSDEILKSNQERHRAVLKSWFEFLDSYWIARGLSSKD